MSQDYTEEQKASIAACNATLEAVKLPTYSSLEERLYQTLTACAESLEMGKKLFQALNTQTQELKTLKRGGK